jgi:hypothetical protein
VIRDQLVVRILGSQSYNARKIREVEKNDSTKGHPSYCPISLSVSTHIDV